MLRSWGFYTEDFARSWIFTSSLTNFTVLSMPVVAVMLRGAQRRAGRRLHPGGRGLVVCAVAVYVVVRIVRSEAFARRAGALAGRLVRWAAGVTKRRPDRPRLRGGHPALPRRPSLELEDAGPARDVGGDRHLRDDRASSSACRCARPASAATRCTIGAIAVVYTVVRLLTIVNFTPGGVGVTEALYISALLAATGGEYESQIVAGVFLFRGLTYVGPILLGAVALLIWRFRRSWRVHPPAEPVGAAAVGAVIADREPTADVTRAVRRWRG